MLGLEKKAARFTWTAALVALLMCCVYLIREALIIFAVALLLTYLLYPLYTVLTRILPGRSRGPALALVYIILFGVVAMIVTTIGSRVVEEATSLANQAPAFIEKMRAQGDNSSIPQPAKSNVDQVLEEIRAQVEEHSTQILSYVPQYSMKILSAASYLLFAVVIPIISFFMLKDGSLLREDLIELFAAGRNRELMEDVLSDIHVLLLQYMRALFTLCLAVFASFALVFSIMGVPYHLLLATIAFPLEFVPLVGPMSAAVIIMTVVLFAGYAHPVWVLIFLGVYRLFQDYILSPHIMSAGVELHPLMVIFGVFAGGEIGGVAGIFLSVPVLAMSRVIIHRIRKQRVVPSEHVVVG
ncbi:MAG TPA: AI-2E family transporter [Bryobacteraceae bacterium]|jgi:predicted PurR-regulated permease PerM